jgi:glutaminyl-tRNA synthetase
VRLRYAYLITCNDVVRDPDTGEVVELRCTYDPETRGGSAPDGRKVRGTIHWVSCEESLPCEVRLYDRLFSEPNPEEDADFHEHLNPTSLVILPEARVEPSVAEDVPGTHYQFERLGYFVRDLHLTEHLMVKVEKADKEEAPAGEDTGRCARDEARAADPELGARFERYQAELGLPEGDVDLLTGDLTLAELFEGAVAVHDAPRAVANWIVNDLLRELKDREIEDLPFGGEEIGRLVALVENGTISGRTAKDVFARLAREGGDPREIVRAEGVEQISEPAALRPIVEGAIDGHPEQAARYSAGQSGLLGFFVGQVMRETGGRANPEVVQRLVREKLA